MSVFTANIGDRRREDKYMAYWWVSQNKTFGHEFGVTHSITTPRQRATESYIGASIKAILLMRSMRVNRMSYQSIADELNKREIKPSRAEKWYASSVKAVLESRMQSEVG
jgi:hypothetical protein